MHFFALFPILLWPQKYKILRSILFSVCSTKHLKGLSKEKTSPFFLESDGKNPISRYIYNLLTDGIKGSTKKDMLLPILNEISVRKFANPCTKWMSVEIQSQFFLLTPLQHMHDDLPSLILDIIGIVDAETSNGLNDNISQEDRTAFCHIVKDVEKFIPEKLLKERLEIDTLQDVGTIKNKIFYTKFIKVKTKL